MKIAICFGGYCPMHQGHLDVIMQAKKENDVCFVIVCGYDNEPRGWEINLNLTKRTTIIKSLFSNDEQIVVLSINDTELGIDESMSNHNWTVWQEKVKELIFSSPHYRGKYIGYKDCDKDSEITWYVAEKFYKQCIENNNVLNAKVKLIEKNNPVSGTLIRNNPIKFFNKITKPFKPYLCHNILVVGTASEGKSTLVKDISTYFDIPYTPECGRKYMERRNMKDVDLEYYDFEAFLYDQDLHAIHQRTLSKNGIFICDTDLCVTLMYAKAYANDENINITEQDYERLYAEAKKIYNESEYKWNKIFVLPPNQKFVDDGTRYMKQASIEERNKNYEILSNLLNDFYPEVSKTILKGSFLENFNEIKSYIKLITE